MRTVSLGRRVLPGISAAAPHASRRSVPPPLAAHPDFRGGRLRPASADRAVCDGLARPPASCLAAVHGARAPMLSTDFCFPLLSNTSTRARCAPSISPRLAPRPFARRLAPSPTEAGGPGVSRRRIRFDGRFQVGARRCLPRVPETTESLMPLSPPRGSRLARRESALRTGRPRSCPRAVREGAAHATIRGTFHRRLPARTRGPHPVSRTVT